MLMGCTIRVVEVNLESMLVKVLVWCGFCQLGASHNRSEVSTIHVEYLDYFIRELFAFQAR
jgi:hypothetical protein